MFRVCDRNSPLTDLVWKKKLGQGAFGQVHLVENRHNNDRQAVKLVRVLEGKMQFAVQEMHHQSRASKASEFVVNMFTWGQISDEFLFMIMEFYGGGDVL